MAKTNVGFQSAPSIGLGTTLIGGLVALRPIRTDTLETTLGMSEATVTEVLEVHEDGSFVAHGKQPIFWSFVRRQLEAATPEVPWVAGRLERPGNAYRIEPLTDDDTRAVKKALGEYGSAA